MNELQTKLHHFEINALQQQQKDRLFELTQR
jgi:hypothetical protein